MTNPPSKYRKPRPNQPQRGYWKWFALRVRLVGSGLRDYTTATHWNPRFKLKFGLTSSFLLSPLSLVSWILDSVQLILSAGVMAIGSQFHVHLYTFLSLVRRSLLADRLSYVNCRTGSQWDETLTVSYCDKKHNYPVWASLSEQCGAFHNRSFQATNTKTSRRECE